MLKKISNFWRSFRTRNRFPVAAYGLGVRAVVLVFAGTNLYLWCQPRPATLLQDSAGMRTPAKEACTTNVHPSDIVNALTKASRTNQKMTRADVDRLRRETVGETGEKLSAAMAQELEEYIRCNEIFLNLCTNDLMPEPE